MQASHHAISTNVLWELTPPLLNQAQKCVRPELPAHLLNPLRRLPRRARPMVPSHEQAGLAIERRRNLLALQAALVKALEWTRRTLDKISSNNQTTVSEISNN